VIAYNITLAPVSEGPAALNRSSPNRSIEFRPGKGFPALGRRDYAMKNVVIGIAMAAFSALGVVLPQSGASAAEPPSNMVEMPAANWLFVQTGSSFTSDGKTLTIHGVAPQTLMFSDRPERMTGDVLTGKFVDYWTGGKDDFQKDPPNATVSTVIDGKTDLVVVELLNPHLDGDALTYEIRPLSGTLPASGKQISVFIDWWYGPGWHARWGWGHGPGPWAGGRCWRGPYGGLHCRPWWGY
jgi:hypothetical protein